MRKLVLFGLLALALGTSLFLEQRLTRAKSVSASSAPGDATLEILLGSDAPAPPRQTPPPARQPEPTPAAKITPPASPARETPASKTHRLGPDETLEALCKQRYGSELYAESLAARNGLANPAAAKAGQVLEMPERTELEKRYRARKGDTLSDIAKRVMGSTRYADRLASWNRLENKNQVRENQILRIPD